MVERSSYRRQSLTTRMSTEYPTNLNSNADYLQFMTGMPTGTTLNPRQHAVSEQTSNQMAAVRSEKSNVHEQRKQARQARQCERTDAVARCAYVVWLSGGICMTSRRRNLAPGWDSTHALFALIWVKKYDSGDCSIASGP